MRVLLGSVVRGGWWFCGSILLVALPCSRASAMAGHRPQASAFPAQRQSATAPPVGQTEFESRCSSCHGLDGRGGEHGPNIATEPGVRRLPDRTIFGTIHDGIPSKGMPAFGDLTDRQISSIVSYLRFLGGRPAAGSKGGEPQRGKGLFFG